MTNVLNKETLKNGYYYSGYVLQTISFIGENQPIIICMWDQKQNCFWSWEYEGNLKVKRKFCYLPDINDEINSGFLPMKETFPKEDEVII